MQSLKRALHSKWLHAGVAGIICALIFTLGPQVSIGGFAPLDSLGSQILASILIPVGYTAIYMIQSRFENLAQSRVSEVLNGFGTESRQGDDSVSPDRTGGRAGATAESELKVISTRFREALATLKARRFAGGTGRQWLYQLPWYVMIGPPGSGKTTAIVNSGFSFPIAENVGRRAIGGIGGTRNCDWWFTDEAVLVDTAGEYLTPEADPGRDKKVWLGFLRLLRRYRTRQPLNGVVVAISISELSLTSEEVRLDQANCIRQRVLELYRELSFQVPVYVLLTKSDLIAGFFEFFDDLGREGREAVWGFTFAQELSRGEGDPMASYVAQYDALVGRLNERLLERMQQESNIQRRALVFGFPQQVASLKHITRDFLHEAFARNSFEQPIMLRGIYFASGTQIGTPFDRVAEARSRAFNIARLARPVGPRQNRSYFISRLFSEVIFAEAGLVKADPRAERRQRQLRYGIYAIITAVMVTASAFWMISYARNLVLIDRVRLAASSYVEAAKKLQLDRVDNSDLRPILPLLQRLRNSAEGDKAGDRFAGSGLDQTKKVGVQAQAAYRRSLNTVLLPRLIFRLETLLAERHDDPQFLYQALKVYLMLGQQGPLQRQFIKNWMVLDWEVLYPAEAGLRRALADHLDALLETRVSNVWLNDELIERTRAKLQTISMPRRVLDIIATSPQASQAPTWRLSDHAGPMPEGVLIRKSGQPLSAGVPGVFTRAGFTGTFLPLLPQVADEVAADAWVLDARAVAPPAGSETSQNLQRAAADLYAQELAFRWDQLIGDISVRPMGTVDDVLRTLNALSAPTSPMRLFLAAAAQETKLDPPPTPRDASTQGDGAAQGKERSSELADLFHSRPSTDTPAAHARLYLHNHFRWLHQLVDVPADGQAGAQAPIDSAIRDLGELYRSLSETQGLAGSNSLHSDRAAAAIRQIEAGAANLPEPIQQWILGIGRRSSDLSISNAKHQLASAWASGPGKLCRRATEGRYPFTRGSNRDIPLSDFAQLFGRNGAIDTFFAQHRPQLAGSPESSWKGLPTRGADFPINPGTLVQFERAAAIRDSTFQDAGSQPSVGFQLTVAKTDPLTDTVVVNIDNQRLEQRRGAGTAMHFRWPASGGASVTFIGSEHTIISERGAWALFRLLQRAQTRRLGGADRIQVRLEAGRHWGIFVLQADSVMNPLSSNLLSQFRCPQFF
ncbi:type VI secretion system membrane subunit TssM [Mesorhizobium sp. 128a]